MLIILCQHLYYADYFLSFDWLFQDTDVHILEEDQQKINKFARLNAKFEELKDELKSMQVTQITLDSATYGLFKIHKWPKT